MNLPPLPIPELPAEFMPPIPHLVHPLVVHFAIAIPFLILLMELINLAVRKRTLGVMSFVYMVLLTLILYEALLTGGADAHGVKESLDAGTTALLAEHKQWAVYLFYASVLLMLFKLLSVLVRKTPLRVLFLLILILFTAATLATGKRGGALVYEHGVNVKAASSAVAAPSQAAPAKEMKEAEHSAATEPSTAEENKGETPAAPAVEGSGTEKSPAEADKQSAPAASETPTPEEADNAAAEAPKKEEPAAATAPSEESKAQSVTEQAAQAAEPVKKEAAEAMQKAEEAVAPAEAPSAGESAEETPHAQ